MEEIDARGLACPAPVLQTKAALQEDNPVSVRVVVDNAASQQNVQRLLESENFLTTLEQDGDDYLVIGTCDSSRAEKPQLDRIAWRIGSGTPLSLRRPGCQDG